MASVYLARCDSEHGSGRLVAVKLIHPHLANDREFIEMFMDEAELASQIRHPNVCAVLDYALRQDESYLVMEHLTGESLMSVGRRIERSKDLDPQRLARCVARVLADACEGLHAAHELTDVDGEPLHVVHRDVSPENVFVTYDGIAKVMDFGVAAAAHKRHRTLTGVVKGKFASVAPECLKGRKPDRRADVWGIGVIAWELLTGQRLFRSSGQECRPRSTTSSCMPWNEIPNNVMPRLAS
jgi:serine/threonine-protein kinase